jgi:hypothetical protein
MNDEPMQLPDSENPHAAEFAVLEALRAENESLKDARLRALAEAENIRRRAEKEKADASQYAVTKFARDMLGIADNFARALAAVPAPVRDAADPQMAWKRPTASCCRLWSAMASRRSMSAASSIPICTRPSPKCPAKASRPATSWMWCRPAT